MLNRTLRALNRLVVRRNADAGLDVRAPDRAAPSVTLRGQGTSRRVRLLGALSLAALLLATFAALPLQAQTTTVTFVSNTMEPPATAISSNFSAQSFRTGGEGLGYTISEIRIRLGTVNTKSLTVKIREDDNGVPGKEVATLIGPVTLAVNANNTFTAPLGTLLNINETYWLSMGEGLARANIAQMQRTASDGETAETGWSIGDNFSRRNNESDDWTTNTNSLMISIHGSVARLMSSDATLSDLAVTDRDGNAVTLDPAFASGEYSYLASVGYPVSQVTVLPTKNDDSASFRFLDGGNNLLPDANGNKSDHQVDLLAGELTLFKVQVTAEDGTTQTYRVSVTRAGQQGEVLVSEQLLSLTEGGQRSYNVRLDRRPAASVAVTIGGHAGTNVTPNPTSLTFTTLNWNQPRWVSVSPTTDSNNSNESVRLTHTTTSMDSLFHNITGPSVIVNVDEQDPPDHHIRTIRLPQGSYDLPPGDKALPEEEFDVWTGDVFGQIEGVAEGHIWRPSGLWGEPATDTIWVVDPSHFGIHALKLSELKQGRVERHVAADTSEFDQRLNYRCHFDGGRASGDGNPSLTVMWGHEEWLLIANDESSSQLDLYTRSGDVTSRCFTTNVTAWAANGQSYTSVDEYFKSPFRFTGGYDLSRGPLTVWGIWANDTRVWLSGPSSGLSAGVYTFPFARSHEVAEAPGYDGHIGASYGLWSDGTTMWVATNLGWLRAYNLTSGSRSALFDIRIQTYGMPPGDIWSDGETIWVTNRIGTIDAYELPDRPYASTRSSTPRATEAGPLTAHFASAPEAHDGQRAFNVQIAFSDDLEIAPEEMRDHALEVSGGRLTDAAPVDDRQDLWELTIEPQGTGPVSIVAAPGGSCKLAGELCTADGRPLTVALALQVAGPTTQPGKTPATQAPANSAPDAPNQPQATAVFVGGVDLEWDDVPGADSYDVQTYRGGQWVELPGDGVEIAFYGAGAIISGLDPQASLWFQVRAANAHGVSDWSPMLYMNSTSQFKLGRQARPANAPASGAPVIVGRAQPGQPLWANTTGIEDGNGLDRVRFQYQWMSNDGSGDADIAGATQLTHLWSDADEGKTLSVRVSFIDRLGYAESLTSASVGTVAAAPPVNSRATGALTISGTAEVGQMLTADTSNIGDSDGLTNVVYQYQWLADDGSSVTEISGATGATYTLQATDEGATIKVQVSFSDDLDNEESLTSSATGTVSFAIQQQTANSSATGALTISGTAEVGQMLTANTSGIADSDGLTNVVYQYQWLADDGSSVTEISGATGATYTLQATDEAATIKVQVSFSDDLDNEESLISAAVGPVAAAPTVNSRATGALTISGTAQVGQMLTADTSGITDGDGLTNVVYEYQWLADFGGLVAEISGATGATYTLQATDEGATIKVKVSFSDDADNPESLTSTATAVVAAPEPPAMPTGLSPSVSQDTVTLSWDAPQDDSVTGYVILRRDREIHPVGTFVTIAGDTGSTDTTYTDDTVEPDKQYVYRIKAINKHGEVSEMSDWVRADTPAVPVPDKPTGLSAAVSHDAVTLAWNDPQDDSITGYVILRRDRAIHPEGTFVTIAGDTGSTDTTYTDATVEPDKQYVYRIKAINEHGEVSEKSRWIRAYTPAAPAPAGSPAR